ncbi:hypothetical protein D7231_34745, partial [Streptomyces klenkii]
IGPDVRDAYRLPAQRLERLQSAWTKEGRPTRGPGKAHGAAFWPLVQAGWHRARKPEERPIVMGVTTLQHPEHGRFVRLVVADWLRAGEFPRGGRDDAAGAMELAYRLERFNELTGWNWTSSAGNTAVDALRGSVSATARHRPRWVPENSYRWPKWGAADAWTRTPTDEERTLPRVLGWDQVKAYLPAYGQAIVTGDELRHEIGGEFDPGQAGLWLITVPEWPHPLLPSPVPEIAAGGRVWVGTAVVKMFHDLGLEPAIQESWTGKATSFEGFRTFYSTTWNALKTLEAADTDAKGCPLDPDEAAVWNGLKALYRTCHGKLREPGQSLAARPDWGIAVRDAAWTGVLRKVYKAGGVLPMAKNQGPTPTPRFPLHVDTDEVVYADDGTGRLPSGLVVGRGLGQFRQKTDIPMTEWLKEKGQ